MSTSQPESEARRRDRRLVEAVRGGDTEAFSELVRHYERAAYSVARSVTGAHEEAEDAAQEAFLVALERLDECRDPERFAGWFLKIVRHRAMNLDRRERLRDTTDLPSGLASEVPSPEDWAERAELQSRLSAAVGELTQIHREILLLHDLHGWKGREIAERLEIPHGTVRAHLHVARRKLRELLRDPAPEPETERGDTRQRAI